MQLFVIYIGGTHPQALVELRDMRFVAAHTLEETYEKLPQSWWGTPVSLHVDPGAFSIMRIVITFLSLNILLSMLLINYIL